MNRRHFVQLAAMASAGASLNTRAWAQTPENGAWRTFEITTRVHVLKPVGTTRVWIPKPLLNETPFQRTVSFAVDCPAGRVRSYDGSASESLGMVAAEFPSGAPPVIATRAVVATRNWTVPLTLATAAPRTNYSALDVFLKPTLYVPTDGIVRERALQITEGSNTDIAKAQAIYQWVVENTHRDPKVRGCGAGDIRPMLETGDLGGKCADINALYVGLAKAAGLPARDVYGIRVGPSQLGYKSLGTATDIITKAQHCRAEVHLSGIGWVPVDPADVRKVMLEEPPGDLPATSERVQAARARLFGSWEMNWIAYNYAQDVVLPGSSGPPLHFFMYPQAETAEGRLDSLDPQSFSYEITSREVTPRQS